MTNQLTLDPAMFHAVGDSTGTDRHERLRLTIDSERRVVAVQVLDVDALRRPQALSDALLQAFGAADGARALASLERAGRREEFLARAEETLSGRAPARAPAPPDVSRAASLARRGAGPRSRRPAPPPPVSSDNGYLTVHRGADGRLLSVEADAEWLSSTRTAYLERAILQACAFEGLPLGGSSLGGAR